MSQDVDPGTAKTLLEWGWAAVLGLVGAIAKLGHIQLENRRKGEIKLHERLNSHISDDNDKFQKLMEQQAHNHAELLREVGDIKRELPRR